MTAGRLSASCFPIGTCTANTAKGMPPEAKPKHPARIYNPAQASGLKPQASAAANSASEKGSKFFMVKFKSTTPANRAR